VSDPIGPFEAFFNFRDLGGLALLEGGTTQRGRLFRSGMPDLMSPDEADELVHTTGLRTVIDLRGLDEVPTDLGPLVPRVTRHHLPMWDDELEADEQAHRLAEPIAFLTRNYGQLIERFANGFAEAVALLAIPEAWPALVHCAGGKDRTGLLVALILESVGVAEEAIVNDYVASEFEARRAFEWRSERRGADAHPRWTIDVVQGPALLETLSTIRSRYGSTRGYLIEHGTPPEAFEALRTQLVGHAAG